MRGTSGVTEAKAGARCSLAWGVLPEPGLSFWLPDSWSWAVSLMPTSTFTPPLSSVGTGPEMLPSGSVGGKTWAQNHLDLGANSRVCWLWYWGKPLDVSEA